jgi:hypothetical protein
LGVATVSGCADWRSLRTADFNRAKNSRRVATRYDKLIESLAAFALLAAFASGLSLSTQPSLQSSHPA